MLEALKRLFRRRRYRDAGTGKFVTKNYAKSHPETTVRETEKRHD